MAMYRHCADGTSITQGGVVSRPGMAFTNIIGRSLGRDVLNFGYSGQGYMETSVASFLVKVEDTGSFVIDCNPNMAHVDWCGTFRLNFHRFDRFELDLRGYTQP